MIIGTGPENTPPANERILLCISPSPFSIRLVRATQRMAENLQAEWFAVYVEMPSHARLPQEDQDRVSNTLRFAAQLGAQTFTLSGFSLRETILQFARENHVTKIVVGKPIRRRWRERLFGSVVDQLIWNCGKIDIHVISGEAGESRTLSPGGQRSQPFYHHYAWTTVGLILCTGLVWVLFPYLALANLMMVYLLAVVVTAVFLGRGPSMFAACLSVAAFDFFFVPPYYTFAVENTEYAVTLGVMLIISGVISDLTARIRHQARIARRQERQTALLYGMSRRLTAPLMLDELLHRAVSQLSTIFQSRVAVFLPDSRGALGLLFGEPTSQSKEEELKAAGWVYHQGKIPGSKENSVPGTTGIYLPLRASEKVVGVLRVEPVRPGQRLDGESLRFLETLGSQVALVIEKENLARQAHASEVQRDAERLRNALLSSVSHDLRTPLTVIAGSASSLLEGESRLDEITKRELTQTIYDEARRLDRLVHNILDMSRLQSEEIKLNIEWHVLEEVIGTALAQLDPQMENHPVDIHLPVDLPLVKMDAQLIERVFVNLIDNAVKYTPAGASIEISAVIQETELVVSVADRGPGLPEGEEEKVFEKFYQTVSGRGRGAGLGLTICRSIITAHGGRIWAANRSTGGAIFKFTLPADEPPSLQDESLPEIE